MDNPYLDGLGISEADMKEMVDVDSMDLSDLPGESQRKKKPDTEKKPARAQAQDDQGDDDDQYSADLSDYTDDDNAGGDDGQGDDNDGDDAENKGKQSSSAVEIQALKEALESRIDELDRNAVETKKNQVAIAKTTIAGQVEQIDIAIKQLKEARKKAFTDRNSDLFDAIEERMELLKGGKTKLMGEIAGLDQYAKNLETGAKPRASEKKDDLNPQAKSWVSKRPWFQAQGKDEISEFVRAKSYELAEKGYDINKELHYTELDKIVRRKYPHLYGNNAANGGAFGGKGSGVAGTGQSAPGKRRSPVSNISKASLMVARQMGLDTSNKEVLAKIASNARNVKKGR